MNRALRGAVVALLRAYKGAVSPLLPPACRYVPSCSEYAMEAVDRHGVVRGSWMAIWRVLRCHPFVKGGFDPVRIEDASTVSKKQPWISTDCHDLIRVHPCKYVANWHDIARCE